MARADANSSWTAYRSYAGAREPWTTAIGADTVSVAVTGTDVADLVDDPQVVEWVDLRGVAEFNALLRIRVQEYSGHITIGDPGVILMARMPDSNASWSDTNCGYAFQWRGTENRLASGSVSNVLGGSMIELATSTSFLVRFVVSDTGSAATVRVRVWEDGTPEPSSWTRESTFSGSAYIASVGRFGFANGGNAVASGAQSDATYSVELLAVDPSGERVRSSVSLTVGNILQEVQSPQFELSARQAFFPDVELTKGTLHAFSEVIAPNYVTHQWYPLPVSTEPGLVGYAASTKLGRMLRAYPEPFVARAIDLVGTDTMTAQQVLEQLFARWATEFDWFTYKTVPDLRHRVASADTPADYTDGVGELTLPAIVMRQEESDRRTMRQILDRVLSLFPGTALVQDADGDIALRPTYGPDAPTTPDVTLSTDDIASMSDGVPDTQRIYNLARVTSDGGDFEEDTALTTSLFGLIAFGDEPEAALGPDGENVLPTTREEVDVNAWHAFDTLAAGDTIDVEYTIRMYALYYGSDPSMTNPPSDVTLETTATATITLTLGAGETVIRVSDLVGEFLGSGGIDAYADIAFEADRASGIYVGYKDFTPYGAVRHFSGTSWFRFAWVVEVDTTGLGYVEAPETVIGKFGYDLTTDEILSTDGSSNALAVSQATYGERELPLSSDLFPLTLEQALRIAEGAVLHYINPRTIYRVEQAWWNAFPVKPDHIGRMVELPSTEEGFVQARDYVDSFEDPEAPQLASTFELVLTEAAFTTEGLLAFDDGELWSFDDGSLRKADE